jgi:hypothetical protein
VVVVGYWVVDKEGSVEVCKVLDGVGVEDGGVKEMD